MTYTKLIVSSVVISALIAASVAYPIVSAKGGVVPMHASTHDSIQRVAKRLQGRIERRFGKSPSLLTLQNTVQTRRNMFAQSITVAFQDDKTGEEISTWTVSLGRYPDWMVFDVDRTTFTLDESVITQQITTTAPDGLSEASFAFVRETTEEGKIIRATIEGSVASGQLYNPSDIVETVIDAFEDERGLVVLPVESVQGAVLYNDGQTSYALHELGVGRSEFASSPWGRKQNVRKAMNEKANGVVIPAGSTFSFNATLGGAITHGNGWFDSLIIVNGKDLEPAPGGGICQAATTVFRAAVSAGLPIKTRKSHSLYVTYYKQYGVGLDATVFPGRQDMQFENDTQGPLILIGKTDEHDNAYSTLYGIDDERSVVLDGPYFGSTYKDPVLGRTLRGNEVAWIQRVQNADGTSREQLLVAQYLQLPKSVALEFQPVMHGSADLVAEAL